jgi:Flp pilus assembly protein TadD
MSLVVNRNLSSPVPARSSRGPAGGDRLVGGVREVAAGACDTAGCGRSVEACARRRATDRGTREGAGKGLDPAAVDGGMAKSEIDLHAEYLRAEFFLSLGQPTRAARIVAPVVDAEPANEAAVELLARAYFGSAQLGRAEEALVRLVDLAPANGWARRALARTLERRSRADEALPHHRMADALGAA